jgi:hypothetical protein
MHKIVFLVEEIKELIHLVVVVKIIFMMTDLILIVNHALRIVFSV